MDPILVVIIIVVALGLAVGLALRSRRGSRDPGQTGALPERKAPAGQDGAGPAAPAAKATAQPRDESMGPSDDAVPPGVGVAPPAAAAPAPLERDDAVAARPDHAVAGAQPAAASAEDLEALRKGLATTRGGFVARLAKIFGKKQEIDPALLDEIEEVLITADIGVKTANKILGRLRERLERQELSDAGRVWSSIREEALAILGPSPGGIRLQQQPTVILVVGVNGVGKTTTIGKLASRYHDEGKKVILAAGDTFRAAAVLQLEVWGRRVGCPVVKGKERADPSAVIFDAIKRAQDEGADVVIADTAGRLHTKAPLMDELKKVSRTVNKALGGRDPDETLLVLDATNGQNAIQQAQIFRDAVAITGIALTKLDGTAKGGVVLGIVDEHRIPVRYIGVGERVEDLREFDAHSFVQALFDPDDESMAA